MGMKMDLQEQINRLRFQLKELAGSVSMEENSMAVFFIEQNWGDEEFDAIADVFDRYDADLLNGASTRHRKMACAFARRKKSALTGRKIRLCFSSAINIKQAA